MNITPYRNIAVIIKGNPIFLTKEDNRKLAERFYKTVEGILKNKGYSVIYDEGIPHTTPTQDASVRVGHSRGNDRLQFADKNIITIALDTLNPKDGDSPQHYKLSNMDFTKLNNLPKIEYKESFFRKW